MTDRRPAALRRRHLNLSVRWYLLGVGGAVLAAPVVLLLVLRIGDRYLVRQTERQLISQSVAIAEAWREEYRREMGISESVIRPPGRSTERYVAVEPTLNLDDGIAGPQAVELPVAPVRDTAAVRAGQRLEPVLRRAQVFNLSAVRVLDENGCVVATTRGDTERCMGSLPEVRSALQGRYASLARERISDEPAPSYRKSTARRRGSIRVFTALPVFSDGAVVAVVRASRTSMDAATTLWRNRRWVVVALLGTLVAAIFVALLFATFIARPLRALTRAAQAVQVGKEFPDVRMDVATPSEIRALRDALGSMADGLQRRSEYVQEFALSVSHELKTPLTSVRGAAELLKDNWTTMSEPQKERFVSNIEVDSIRMEMLVNRLLELARAQNLSDSVEQVNVHSFFEELRDRYAPNVELRFGPCPKTVEVDPARLAAAVTSLIDNAVRHGLGKPITVDVGSQGRLLRVRVADEGSGISDANCDKVFGRFFTTERDDGGTGLGLTIAQTIARSRGGDVWLESPRRPTVFVLTL